jgi:hypothetical protein
MTLRAHESHTGNDAGNNCPRKQPQMTTLSPAGNHRPELPQCPKKHKQGSCLPEANTTISKTEKSKRKTQSTEKATTGPDGEANAHHSRNIRVETEKGEGRKRGRW